jgi:hypothetical protein
MIFWRKVFRVLKSQFYAKKSFFTILGGGERRVCPPPGCAPELYCKSNTKNVVAKTYMRKILIFHTKYPNNFRASLRNWKKKNFWRKIVIFHTKYPKILAPPSATGKNMILWRKIVIFHTKYPKNVRTSFRN